MARSYYLAKWVQNQGPLEIFRFDVNEESGKELARLLRDKGLPITATQLRRNFDYLGVYLLNGLAKGARESISRAIPWDSLELDEQHVHIDEATEQTKSSCVFIDHNDHFGNRRTRPEYADDVALFLDHPVGPNSDLYRTNPSRGANTGPETKDWIADAQLDFQSRKNQILQGLI